MRLADIFGIDIDLPKADQPEAEKKAPEAEKKAPEAGQSAPEAAQKAPEAGQAAPENKENNSDNSDNSKNSEFLTKTEFSDMLKKELAEFFKDIQAANRSKDQGNGEPVKSFDDVLREIYEQ